MALRDIDVDQYRQVEVWRGRRLLLEGADGSVLLMKLPGGAMSRSAGVKDHVAASFGSVSATSVRLTGSARKGRLAAIVHAIIEMERPKEARKL